jgi:hypothetical protein
MNGLTLLLHFPASSPGTIDLLLWFDQIRRSCSPINELLISLKEQNSVDIVLKGDNGWSISWADVSCDPALIVKASKDKNIDSGQGSIKLKFIEVHRDQHGFALAKQPVPTSDAKPIDISKFVLKE